MIRLRDTRHPNTSSFLSNAIKIAEYYGFIPFDEAMHTRPLSAAERKRLREGKNQSDMLITRREERPLAVAAKRASQIMRGFSETLLLWRTVHNSGKERGVPASVSLELHVIGSPFAISEALLMVVANAIAEEAGIEKRMFTINNIGSAESSSRFVRDVGTYLRKHIESISPTLRPRAALDPLGTLIQLIERGHPAVPRAPQAMEYLTEEERRRFWDLLEYLEVFGLPYELSAQVLGSRDFWAQSLFEISAVDGESGTRYPFAFGGRYDPIASRFAMKPTPAAMITIGAEIRGGVRVKPALGRLPAIYYAHLGTEARRKSLSVLETLRRAEIPVYQGLLYERIGEQMAAAKKHATPYILIMGHKEAMEGTILVREVSTNSQDAIALPELPNYLKRHRVGNWKVETRA